MPEEEINQYKQLYDVAQARFIAVFTQKKLEINLEIRTSLLSIDALKMQLEQQFSGDYEEEIGGFLEKGKKVRGLKDGLSELFDKNGKLIKTVEWKRGLRHGSEKIVDSYSEPITWSLGIPLKYYSIQGFKEFSFEFKPDTKRVSFKVSENSKEILDSEFLFLSKEEILEETRDLPTAFFVKDNIGFVQSALILDGNFTYYSEQSDSFLTGNFSNGAPLSLNWEFSDGQKYSLRYGDSQEKDILTGTFSDEGIVASLIGTFVTGYGFEGRTFCEENGFTEQTEFTKGKESHILIHNGDHKLFDYELGKDANKHTVYAKSGKKAIQFETHKYTDDEFDLGGAFIKYDEFEIPRLKCNYNTRPRENMTSLNMATKGNLLKWEVYYKNSQLAFKVFPAILPKAKNFNTRSVQSYYEDGTEYQSMSFFSKGIKLYKRKGQLWRKGEFKNSRDIFGENGLKNLGLSAVPIGTHYEYDENGKTLKTIECDGLNSFGILYPELLTFREIKSVDKIENYHDKHLLMLDDLNPKDYTKHSDYFFPKKSKAHNIFRQITTKQVAIRPLSEISNFFRKIQIFNKENHDNENHFFSFQNSYSSFTKFATQDAVQSFSKTSFDNKFFEWMENPSSFGGTKVLQKIRRTLQNKETELDLYKSQIVNITPITNLDKLKKLILSENQVTNLSPLKGLLSLNELALTQNKISDLSPLAGLEGLEELYLGENPISDISPLSNLLGLKILVLRNCKVTNIEPLMKLKSLEKLSLEGNLISFQQKNLIQTSLPYTKISFD